MGLLHGTRNYRVASALLTYHSPCTGVRATGKETFEGCSRFLESCYEVGETAARRHVSSLIIRSLPMFIGGLFI